MDESNSTRPYNESQGFGQGGIFIAASFIASICIFATNIPLLCIYRWRRRKLLNLRSNELLLSLWICNFTTGISVVLTTVINVIPSLEKPHTSGTYTYRIMVDIFATAVVKATVMHLCGITLDRYISIFCAYSYKTIVTVKSIRGYIALSWIIPILASSIQWAWLHKAVEGDGVSSAEDEYLNDTEIWYSLASFAIFLAVPLSMLAVAYLKMFIEIRRIVRYTPRHHLELSSVSAKKRKVIYVFSLMYLTFVILAMPYFSLRLWIDVVFWKTGVELRINRIVVHSTEVMKHLTAIITTVLYTVTSPEIRAQVKDIKGVLADKSFRLKSYSENTEIMTHTSILMESTSL